MAGKLTNVKHIFPWIFHGFKPCWLFMAVTKPDTVEELGGWISIT